VPGGSVKAAGNNFAAQEVGFPKTEREKFPVAPLDGRSEIGFTTMTWMIGTIPPPEVAPAPAFKECNLLRCNMGKR
jgi:hypothetical protein